MHHGIGHIVDQTRMHSSRMLTASSLQYRRGRGSIQGITLSGRPPRTETPPFDRQTPVIILSCPKLRLRAVIIGFSLTVGAPAARRGNPGSAIV